MESPFDAVIVGARCAGSPLAVHLSRAGLRVCLLDRAAFPSDTLSTHLIESAGVGSLDRLGVLDQVLAARAAVVERIELRVDGFCHTEPWPQLPDDPVPVICVRRTILDEILVQAAEKAGAAVRLSTRVTGLVTDGDAVGGVEVVDEDGGAGVIRAGLVVGADGRGSTVGRLVGARRYHVVPNARFCYWGYFEDVPWEDAALCRYHFWDDNVLFSTPCDSGLHMANAFPPQAQLADFRSDAESSYGAFLAACPPIGRFFRNARRVGPLRSIAAYPQFFRESAGAGWALIGDAGHVTDPMLGLGISDAFRQAEHLAAAVVSGLDGSGPIGELLRDWWSWRDDDLWETHWLGADLSAAGPVPALLRETLALLAETPDGMARYWDIFNHRTAPSEVLTEAVLAAAADRLAETDPDEGRAAALLLADLGAAARQRAVLRTSPSYEPGRRRPPAAGRRVGG